MQGQISKSLLNNVCEMCKNRAVQAAEGNEYAMSRVKKIPSISILGETAKDIDTVKRYCNIFLDVLRSSGIEESSIKRLFFNGGETDPEYLDKAMGWKSTPFVYKPRRGRNENHTNTKRKDSFNFRNLVDTDWGSYRANAMRHYEEGLSDSTASNKDIFIKMSKKDWLNIGFNSGWLKEGAKLEEGGKDMGDVFGDADTELDSSGNIAEFSPSSAENIEYTIEWLKPYVKDDVMKKMMRYERSIAKNKSLKHDLSSMGIKGFDKNFSDMPPYRIIDEINSGIYLAAEELCEEEKADGSTPSSLTSGSYYCKGMLEDNPQFEKMKHTKHHTTLMRETKNYFIELIKESD